MPFYRYISHGRWVIKVKNGEHKRQSRFIYEEINGIKIDIKKELTHHKDENKLNDTPSNLKLVSLSTHGKIHHPKGKVPYVSTEKSRKNLSKAMTGKKNPFYGKKHTNTTKKKIGTKMKGVNIGRKHTKEAKNEMSKRFLDKSYIPKIQELLRIKDKKGYTHKKIAEIVGVHRNTVGNIASNKFKYNHKVRSIEKLSVQKDVYNMEVEEFHNFSANGVIVHNCGHNSRLELSAYRCGRDYIGVDCCAEFMEANRELVERKEKINTMGVRKTGKVTLIEGSSHKVDLPDNLADFSITSPPYSGQEYYGPEKEQLGFERDYKTFLNTLYLHVKENKRILKEGAFCVWFINDFRKDGKYHAFHIDLYNLFMRAKFEPYNIYIVDLVNTVQTCFVQDIIKNKILPKQHEYILVMRKPMEEKDE
jgi:transcriptional regulator with XRE-family HTH domain